jgi:hypothetical protein
MTVVITPKANAEERAEAFHFDLSCLSSLRGCRALCEMMPSVWTEAVRRYKNNETSLPKDELDNRACISLTVP